MRALALSVCLSLSSISCGAPAPPQPPVAGHDPAEALETRLVHAPKISFHAHITADGSIASSFDGEAKLEAASGEIDFKGTFEGKPARAHMFADGKMLQGGPDDQPFSVPARKDLQATIVLGLMRMGILHNLASLAKGTPPDPPEGTPIDDFVQREPATEHDDTLAGKPMKRLEFGAQVKGKHIAEIKLWVDAATGLPVRREQVVHFPRGDAHVVEEYSAFVDGT